MLRMEYLFPGMMRAERLRRGKEQKMRYLVSLLLACMLLMPLSRGFGGSKRNVINPALRSPAVSRTLKTPKVRGRADVKRLPDLTVDISGPHGNNAISVYIHNNGTADAGTFRISFHCEYWPEDEHQFKSKCSLPDTVFTSGLGKKKTTFIKIPKSAVHFSTGYHYIVSVRVDVDKQVHKSNENNNFDVVEFLYK